MSPTPIRIIRRLSLKTNHHHYNIKINGIAVQVHVSIQKALQWLLLVVARALVVPNHNAYQRGAHPSTKGVKPECYHDVFLILLSICSME